MPPDYFDCVLLHLNYLFFYFKEGLSIIINIFLPLSTSMFLLLTHPVHGTKILIYHIPCQYRGFFHWVMEKPLYVQFLCICHPGGYVMPPSCHWLRHLDAQIEVFPMSNGKTSIPLHLSVFLYSVTGFDPPTQIRSYCSLKRMFDNYGWSL